MTQTTTKAAYLVQRAARRRFSFGPTWVAAVTAGTVTDKDKLVAHAVKIKAAQKNVATKLRFETLLAKVQAKLVA